MFFIHFLHSIFFVIYLYLAVYVIRKNNNSTLNITLFLLMLLSGLQSLSLAVIRFPNMDMATANIFMHVLSISLTAFAIAAFLSFVYLTKIYKPGIITYSLLCLYLGAFIIYQLTTQFASVSQRDENGIWIIEFSNSFVLALLDITHNGLLIAGFIMLIIYYRKNSDIIKRKQIKIILFAGLISYSISLSLILFYTITGISRMPMLNDIYLSIFLFGFIYSITKFEFLEITPSQVVDEIIEKLPVGVIIADNNNDIIRTNDAFYSIFNKLKQPIIKWNLVDVFHQYLDEKSIEIINSTNQFERIKLKTENNQIKIVNLYFNRLCDDYHRPIGSLTLIHDIDDLVKTQEKLSKQNLNLEAIVRERTSELFLAKEKAEESDKLKTAFLQNMSHEIRTPMNGIIGFANMLKNEGISSQKRAFYSDVVVKCADQLLSIVNDIITISSLEAKLETISLIDINLNKTTNNIIEKYKPQAKEKSIKLILTNGLENEEDFIKTDVTKLTQILTNLLSNAIKFTNHGYIELGYTVKNNFLEFFVKDTGIGVSPEFKDVIFKRFRQGAVSSTQIYGGNGLGLSISKALVEMMGGKIWLESEPGKGSIFYFIIPYHPLRIKTLQKQPVKKIPQANDVKVLVAEDETINYLLIEEILTEMKITVLHARNGKEAIKYINEQPDIDLILMDIKMPDIDGYAAATIIKKKQKDIPIIAQTAYALENEIIKYKGIFDDYITKPIRKETLEGIFMKQLKKS